MRFMVLVKVDERFEAGIMPPGAVLEAMELFNEEMVRAGVLLDAAALKPTSQGLRLIRRGATSTIIDGPFAETKELVAGYWIIEVKSMQDAIAWMKRAPIPPEGIEMEIRPFYEAGDFGDTPVADSHRASEGGQRS